MPAWLLRFLPHIGLALALGFAVWWINDAGYDRAMADRDARDATATIERQIELRASEERLARRMAEQDGLLVQLLTNLGAIDRETRSTIAKEIARDPRLSDPGLGITDGMLDALNRARASSTCAAGADGRIVCAVPTAGAAAR